MYDYVGKRSYLFARLSSLDIPRNILWNVYTLLLLRERVCTELGIALKPMAPDAYKVSEELPPSPPPPPPPPLVETKQQSTHEENLPEVLLTDEARALHAKLHSAGIVDERWQPIGLSFTEKGTLIDHVAEKLGIRAKWKVFGSLWDTNPETLRTSKTRGLDQDKTWAFRSMLEKL